MSQQAQSLNKQIATLLQNAPNDEVTPRAFGMIASVLKEIASQLQHSNYYLIQSQDGGWLLTTLSNRNSPEVEKNVVYAYCSHTIANIERLKIDPHNSTCVELGIIEILFRLIGLNQIDSLILFDESTNTQNGVEISRVELQALCEKQIKRLQMSHQKLMRSRSQKKDSQTYIA